MKESIIPENVTDLFEGPPIEVDRGPGLIAVIGAQQRDDPTPPTNPAYSELPEAS